MPMPEYEFLLRDLRTPLTINVELDPRDVSATWTRRDLGGGTFQIQLPLNKYSPSQMALHQLLEIRRNNQREAIYVVTRRKVIENGKNWIIGGIDLLRFWTTRRLVGALAQDAQQGFAERICKYYVDHYIGPSAEGQQKATVDMALTVPWIVEAPEDRGNFLNFTATRRSLFSVVQELCGPGAGDLLPEVIIRDDYEAYEFRITLPVDRTVESGNVPFSLDWDNVQELEYEEDWTEHQTYFWVAGEGSGDARAITAVDHTSSVGRFEGFLDASYAIIPDERIEVGDHAYAKGVQQLVSISAQPYRNSQNAVYREDWDVGSDVTFADLRVREEGINVRIVAATVKLTRSEGELITFELGQYKADSTLRKLVDSIKLLQINSRT